MEFAEKVLSQLKQIQTTQGSKAKAELLKVFLNEKPDHFKSIVRLMLDPFVTFGVNKLDRLPIVQNDPPWGEEEFYNVLFDLRDRRLTGGAALAALSHLWSAGVSPDLLGRIMTKDPGAGFGATTVNKIIPKLIPTFPYMRCSRPNEVKADQLKWAEGVYVQVKEDGMFVNLNVEPHCITMSTRQGNLLPMEHFKHIEETTRYLTYDTQTHGELIVYRNGVAMERALGNGFINSVIGGEARFEEGDEVIMYAWDTIPLESVVTKGRCLIPYKTRFEQHLLAKLDQAINPAIRGIDYRLCYSPVESRTFLQEILSRGGEGTIEKNADMIWIDGTSKDQIKRKMVAECDLRIKGLREGKGKNANTFGSVICGSEDDLLEVAVSGMDDKTRQYIADNIEALLGTIMEVQYNVITEPSASNNLHSLFLPRIKELNKHKTVADTLEQIKAGYQMALENA